MKQTGKTIILLAIALAACFTQYISAQNGSWHGNLELGGNTLTLVFHLNGDSCTMDSPDQNAKGIKVIRNKSMAPFVSLEVPSIGASFKGAYMGKQIAGTFTQQGYEFPLTLKPGELKRNRPQTPKDPFPYSCEEVSFTNEGITLNGTLSLPEGYTKDTPVFLMVTGSGLQNRDEEIFEHKPFAVIADLLARNGIATLRYDDRGYGSKTANIMMTTTQTAKSDAQAGIDLLRKRFNKVGIIGHSEGGTIAMMLAAEQEIDMAISLAGMAISGKETLLYQNENSLKQMGYSNEVIAKYMKIIGDIFDQIIADKDPVISETSTLPKELIANIQQSLPALKTPYIKELLKLDISAELPKIKCPLLAINGTKDVQVNYKKNLSIIESGVKSPKTCVHPFEGLNHLFQHCKTGAVTEYKEIEETISEDVLNKILHWIKSL